MLSTTPLTESQMLLSLRPVCRIHTFKRQLSTWEDLWMTAANRYVLNQCQHRRGTLPLRKTTGYIWPSSYHPRGTLPWGVCKAASFPSFPLCDPLKRWEILSISFWDKKWTNTSEEPASPLIITAPSHQTHQMSAKSVPHRAKQSIFEVCRRLVVTKSTNSAFA